jgi:hypothetical protein
MSSTLHLKLFPDFILCVEFIDPRYYNIVLNIIINILPIILQHIISLLLFVVKSKNKILDEFWVCNISTRNYSNFYQPLSHLTIHKKVLLYGYF